MSMGEIATVGISGVKDFVVGMQEQGVGGGLARVSSTFAEVDAAPHLPTGILPAGCPLLAQRPGVRWPFIMPPA
jgi:hypothetical protein